MAAERYLSRRIPDLRVGINIDKIGKKPIPSSIHPCFGVPLIATETFLCLSESFLCNLQHTKSPYKMSERKGNDIIIP